MWEICLWLIFFFGIVSLQLPFIGHSVLALGYYYETVKAENTKKKTKTYIINPVKMRLILTSLLLELFEATFLFHMGDHRLMLQR